METPASNYLVFDNQGTGRILVSKLLQAMPSRPVVYLTQAGESIDGAHCRPFDYAVNFLPCELTGHTGEVFISLPFSDSMVSYLGNILNQIRRSGSKPFIIAESLYGANKNLMDNNADYILHHYHAAEEALLASTLPYTVMRPTLTFEFLLETFFDAEANTLAVPFAEASVAACSRADVATLAIALSADVASCSQKVFTLTGSRPISGQQMAQALSLHYNREIVYTPTNPSEADEIFRRKGFGSWQIEQYRRIFDECRMGWWGKYLATDFVKITKAEPLTFEKFLSLQK